MSYRRRQWHRHCKFFYYKGLGWQCETSTGDGHDKILSHDSEWDSWGGTIHYSFLTKKAAQRTLIRARMPFVVKKYIKWLKGLPPKEKKNA